MYKHQHITLERQYG
jgi:hypothetical protein